jgi:hypothetical protein
MGILEVKKRGMGWIKEDLENFLEVGRDYRRELCMHIIYVYIYLLINLNDKLQGALRVLLRQIVLSDEPG